MARRARRFEIKMRACSKCKVEKEPSCFGKKTGSRLDGFRSACKNCTHTQNRAWKKANAQRNVQNVLQWQKRNPLKTRATKHAYRARKLGALGIYRAEEWIAVLNFFSVCLRCGVARKLTIDHIVPLVRGGDNTIMNLQPLCQPCNSSKHAAIIDYRPEYMNMSCE